ncbi:MAG: hypothetical protein KKA90_00915 [Nanoarchaeota archaeon]|nr:hypothetical protein [Nanoarchaeota archaeon]
MFSFLGKSKPKNLTPPTQRVSQLSGQGLSDPEIINTLRREGYSPKEVDMAMRTALKGAAGGTPLRLPPKEQFATGGMSQQPGPETPAVMQPGGPYQPPQQQAPRNQLPALEDMDDVEAPLPGELDFPALPGTLQQSPQHIEQRQSSRPPITEDNLDDIEPVPLQHRSRHANLKKESELAEMAEGVVEEKWDDFEDEVKNLRDDFTRLQEKVANLERAIENVKSGRGGESADITTRLDAYRESITEVNTRLEGMERAVKDSLTPMMQTMRSLSEAIKSMKDKK